MKIILHVTVNNSTNDDDDDDDDNINNNNNNNNYRNKPTSIYSTLLYHKYKPELVLESANMILSWDGSIRTDPTVDFNVPDIVFIDRENKTALLIDLAVCLTHNLSNTKAEKTMKYENLALGIKISENLPMYLYTS